MSHIVRLRCISIVYGRSQDPRNPGNLLQSSETASFADADVPLDVLVDRKCSIHLHTNDDPDNFGRFQVDKVYRFTIEPE